MVKIRYADEFICPQCGIHTALCCLTNGQYKAHCLKCGKYYDVEITTITNADRIRAMTDEELAEWEAGGSQCPPNRYTDDYDCTNFSLCKKCWLDWLRKEAEDETDI